VKLTNSISVETSEYEELVAVYDFEEMLVEGQPSCCRSAGQSALTAPPDILRLPSESIAV